MSADLHIHVLEGCSEADLKVFFHNTLGSKWGAPLGRGWTIGESDLFGRREARDRVSDSPNVWIGEVSWLKAAVLEDDETYVPGPVAIVQELIGEELPVLDKHLRDAILAALKETNSTTYRTSDGEKVEKFLDAHLGKKLFTVSW
jgi:hypothetical protein